MGNGAIAELPVVISGLGKRPLIVTDRGIVEAGIVRRITNLLRSAGINYTVCDKVEPDPAMEIVHVCLETARDSDCDMLIGLGGGSSLDITKVVAVLLTNAGYLEDFIGVNKIPTAGVNTVMIPTTAGTGSEVTPIAVLSDKKQRLKKGIVSDHLYPNTALVDPELMINLPPYITAYTGIDALTHSIEAYTNKYAQPFIDTLALEAIKLIGKYLKQAVSCGDNLQARYNMALASLYGGMCLGSVNTAAVHALAYPLGGIFEVPHGVANSLLLPYVMKFNLTSNPKKFAGIAAALGNKTKGLSHREAADLSVCAVAELCSEIGIVSRLRDLKIPVEMIEQMASEAMKVTRLLNNNPREVTLNDVRMIYHEAY
jgi:alcohol dehydrogenase class IV